MAIAWVGNWTSATFTNATGGTLAGRTSTAGNLVVITSSNSNPATYTITHSQAGTVLTDPQGAQANGSDSIKTSYIENIVGGASHTITITTPAASFSTLNATEYSGIATSSSFDKSAVGTGTSATPLSGATGTTTQADELLIGNGTLSSGSNSSWTAGSGYTMRGNIANASIGGTSYLEDRIVSATGAYTAGATWAAGSGAFVATICTFKAAGGAAYVAPGPLIIGQSEPLQRSYQW